MKWLLSVLIMVFAGTSNDAQERPRVPSDSVEIEVIGCLKGRLLKASDVRFVDTKSGPDVTSRSFRLAGKKDVIKDVKQQNGHLVEVTGLVKRSALDDQGVKITNRIEMGGGSPVSRSGIPSPAENVAVMDVSSVRSRAGSCGG